jgi:hypothetical protein
MEKYAERLREVTFSGRSVLNIHARTLESSLEYLTRAQSEGQEEFAVVRDGLQMTLEVIQRLLSHPAGRQREVLEWYREKLTEILSADHTK